MMTPLYKYGYFGDELSLIVAVLIGIGFGFCLERAGFGNARKLAAQFYLVDMSVFKVMFTAIVTALLGVTYLGWLGWLDLSQVYLVPTYLWPQIVGGLVLGVGFVVGGYCPGTSAAAVATGRIDGVLYALGIFAGTFVYGELYPSIKGFVNADEMGQVTLPEVLGLPWGVIVFAVVLMAVGGFWGATKVERWARDRA
ncbi:MAG TPA: YeeE/YedE thiosulfate transporter family protein [Steroidobacteraceae bacterium]|nr:YeeE/YedE thiosulfate transporter family protein [Steroidobacteraceae bacterium]